jgi:2-oxoglutarate dehydrogenase E1 component
MVMDFGVNAGLVEELYAQYLENPESVDASWRKLFEQRALAAPAPRFFGGFAVVSPPAATPPATNGNGSGNGAAAHTSNGNGNGAYASGAQAHHAAIAREVEGAFVPTEPSAGAAEPAREDQVVLAEAAVKARVVQLVNAYRVRGHYYAHLDPLADGPPTARKELELGNFGLSEEDLDKSFPTADLAGLGPVAPLRDVIAHLEETYCRTIGVEFTQIEDQGARNWLQERMEATKNRVALTKAQQLRVLAKLSEAEVFEQFLHGSYGAGTKRFSCEGGESLIPLLDLLIERGGSQGVEEIVLGMAHRGRLNVLANIMDKSVREIFAAFEDKNPDAYKGGGDVKYHLGFSTDRVTEAGSKVHLTLTFNPSHLEFVNPVVEGRVRAKQDRLEERLKESAASGEPDLGRVPEDEARRRVMPLLIHGDAAFIGQGIVPETLNLACLDGYATGGTIHVIVNNQIGFTTNPLDSRSTRYASDIIRMMKTPVFHVNGEDPEAVVQVTLLAIDYRQRFQQDVVIDMYCYRKYGHNEGDEPRYTQPEMYSVIDRKPTVRKVYVGKLLELGQITESQAEEIVQKRRAELAAQLKDVREKGFSAASYSMGGVWAGYRGGLDTSVPDVATAVPQDRLLGLAQKLASIPEGFKAHPKVLPILQTRLDKVLANEPFDWGTAEALAYATLLDEGVPVRISGQDVRRGTFSHRHAVLFDAETGEPYAPHSSVCRGNARFDIFNSPLSEAGVLGFDFGYSLDFPDALVIWEAQFGDFLNGAQVIIDQFLTSSEDKWGRLSGMVLYLPHGYEGQGPEHSSARLERFLTNSAEDNIQVCNLTTPAQLFHALRRQILRPWRKPLVIMTPKSMLRVAATSKGPHRPVSTTDDLTSGGFQRVIGDVGVGNGAVVDPKKTKKVLLCTGKVYYDLAIAREAQGRDDVAILRLEQLYPIGKDLVDALAAYPDGTPLIWVQEEPLNFGSWYFILANVPGLLGGRLPLSVVARDPSSSPATGSMASHRLEQQRIVEKAFA